jgi:hypothetical protein
MNTPVQPTTIPGIRAGEPVLRPERGIEALYATGHWLLGRQRPVDAASVFRAMTLLAASDERAWLGLAACHEAVEQALLALEILGTGQALLPYSVRIRLARARLLSALERDGEAELALAVARDLADERGDDELVTLVSAELAQTRSP